MLLIRRVVDFAAASLDNLFEPPAKCYSYIQEDYPAIEQRKLFSILIVVLTI